MNGGHLECYMSRRIDRVAKAVEKGVAQLGRRIELLTSSLLQTSATPQNFRCFDAPRTFI